MRIGIDLDGVTYPFTTIMRNYSEHVLGVRLPEPKVWSFFEEWGLTYDEFGDLMRDGCIGDEIVFCEGAPIPGALPVLDALWNDQHEIVIVTHRGEYAKAATETWLSRWGIVYDELHFASDKTQYGLDIMLDDSPSVIRQCRAAGIDTVVFDQPWNHGQFEEPVAYSWVEFFGYVNT